jgi:hypothetical protein
MLAADPRNFDAAWKLARADYWLGGHAPDATRRGFLRRHRGRPQRQSHINRPEGHLDRRVSGRHG